VIVQFGARPGAAAEAVLRRAGLSAGDYRNLHARLVEVPAGMLDELAALDEVSFLSADREVHSLGHLSATTGADAARAGAVAEGAAPLDGTGVGIAVLDSGIFNSHSSFLSRAGKRRVVAGVDFTGEGLTADLYGHGTHVASTAAGGGRIANAAYLGVAPNASIVNLRVLDSRGTGTVSRVLAALEWVLQNRAAYNIRVVNMSLGMPAVDSYNDDPLCRAVRKLVDAGLVVVAAAGNNGKDSAGNKLYGLIHSPGNEPSAVTVGASNTFGTDARRDDAIASYSSRGPTRSSWVDTAGARHYDNLIKPDLVAPGNKLVGSEADPNALVRQNPQLETGVSDDDTRKMMYMSGTSVAAPVVAGAAVLMLQANPRLTPNLVKALLMYTAQPLAGFNLLEQGAGELNVEGAVRLARLVRTDLTSNTALGAPLLTSAAPPTPETTIAGQTFAWAQGVNMGQAFGTGAQLITQYQKIYDLGSLISNGILINNGAVSRNSILISNGILIANNLLTSDGGPIGGGAVFLNTGDLVGDGILISNGTLTSDGILISNSVAGQDASVQAKAALTSGEATAFMPLTFDTGSDFLNY
jgi:subtilisin family serine protease